LLLDLNHKTLTADKLMLEKRKKKRHAETKIIINYARNVRVL